MANLITLTEYKVAEGLQSTKEDAKLELTITSVSQLVKTYCGNGIIDFYVTGKTETLSINWASNIVQLTESPVNVVGTVKERDNLSSAYTTLTENVDYYVDKSTDSIYRVNSNGSAKNWANGPGAVEVVYTAGYEKCPEDLKLAVIDLITYYHKDHHRTARQTIAGASRENKTSSGSRNNPAFPDHIKRVLDLYKNF